MSFQTRIFLEKGGREHTMAWATKSSSGNHKVVCIPGNPGMVGDGIECDASVSLENHAALIQLIKGYPKPVVFPGSEELLAAGIVDDFDAVGIPIVGPTRQAARLETDKAFAAEFLERVGVPIPASRVFTDYGAAVDCVSSKNVQLPLVIKARGICAGKGVVIARTVEEAKAALKQFMVDEIHGEAGTVVVIQEFLVGKECSIIAFSDGNDLVCTRATRDHKPLYSGDRGPNTGGMGVYGWLDEIGPDLMSSIREEVFMRTLRGHQDRGIPCKGILYAGLIILPDGSYRLLEWNRRMPDPETQVILPLLDTPFTEVVDAMVNGGIAKLGELRWKPGYACCVIMAAANYALVGEKVPSGDQIEGLDDHYQLPSVPDGMNIHVIHAGTAIQDNRLVTAGGRVLGVTARAMTLDGSVRDAYWAVERIRWTGEHHRTDIGAYASK
ncbi:MAG: phosphoribosylamine--glycine ligase [Parcubacteria group bacterium]